jgi:hypothetical protein
VQRARGEDYQDYQGYQGYHTHHSDNLSHFRRKGTGLMRTIV